MVNPNPSRAVTVVAAAVASPAIHPSTIVGVIVPVIAGAVVSLTFITWVVSDEFRHASVIEYVLVTIIGHVPLETSLLVTTKAASKVQASLIDNPNPSSAVTLVTAGVAFEALHPSTVVDGIDPVIAGAVLSYTLITCVAEVEFEQASVTT